MIGWETDAICKGATALFFAADGERPERRVEREARARAVCAGCPVRVECEAAGAGDPFGIWGGTRPEDRGFNAAGQTSRSARHARRSSRLERSDVRDSGLQCSWCGVVVGDVPGMRIHLGRVHPDRKVVAA